MTPRFQDHAAHAQTIIERVLAACDPAAATARALAQHPVRGPHAVIALGKAAAAMVRGCAGAVRVSGAPVIFTPVGAAVPPGLGAVHRGDHPIPSDRSVQAGRELAATIGELRSKWSDGPVPDAPALLLLISGGASSIVTLPPPGLSIADVRAATDALLRAGATIQDLNTVRKHIDLLKGGRLAALAAPVPVTALILSDVIGNDPSVIASGPVSPDPTTFAGALAVLDRLGCRSAAPAVTSHLEAGVRGGPGAPSETPKPGDPVFQRVTTRIIASNAAAIAAACDAAREMGFTVVHRRDGVTGEASLIAAEIAGDVRAASAGPRPAPPAPPACLVYGGETTVSVGGATGRGGRNQELALAAAIALDGLPGVAVLSFATDGIDGPTDAAGGIVTGSTCAQARAAGLDPAAALAAHDSFTLLNRTGSLLRTGPTGTNVNDIVAAFVY